ncbi:hypothetical protein SBA2_630015 [Acidobacteriia bacterium SbA2]|nr:hypothetical protein SBA2_630015 [Acidobacteriia bacterium SbA2]
MRTGGTTATLQGEENLELHFLDFEFP